MLDWLVSSSSFAVPPIVVLGVLVQRLPQPQLKIQKIMSSLTFKCQIKTYPVASVVAVAVAVDGFDSGFAAAVRQDCRIAWLPIAVAVVADGVPHSHHFLEVKRP